MIDERLAELRRDPSALRTACEAAVRRVEFGSDDALWVPAPPLAPPANVPPPRRVPEPPAGEWTPHRLAGLDEHERAVLVRGARGIEDEPPAAVLAFPSEEAEDPESGGKWVLHHLLLRWDGPRLEVVRFLTHDEISELTWIDHDEAGRPVRFTTVGDARSVAECVWEDDRCVQVRQDGVTRTGEYDADGLVRVHADGRVLWDRGLHAFDPDPLGLDEAIGAYTAALAAAARRGTADWPDAVAIKVSPHSGYGLDPEAVVVERAFFERATKKLNPGEAIGCCREPAVPLLPLLDDTGRTAWRSLQQREIEPWSLRDALQRELDAAGWPEGVQVFAFGPAQEEERPAPAVSAPPADRAELEALLARLNLPLALADQAQWGLALLPGGTGRSRLGGRPDLAQWPYVEDRPLTHLASIALEELPPFPGRDVLPAAGTLVVSAGLTEEDALWDPTPCDDPRVRFLHLAPGEEAGPAEPPTAWEPAIYDTPPLLAERRVRFEPVLTLPQRPTGLLPEDEVLYDPLWWALAEITPGLTEPGHLLLGHPQIVQWDFRQPGELSVLHLGWDEELGFQFLDGGDLTFHGSAEDVRAGRWGRLTVTANSG